jgi:hypothetical protein
MGSTRSAPRLMTRADLRAHLGGLPWALVLQRIDDRKLPGPVWGLAPDNKDARWDRQAVDRALDAASGLPVSVEAGTAALDRALGFR